MEILETTRTVRSRVLVLADDLTGALEAGAKFAGRGIATVVTVERGEHIPEISNDVSVLVMETETRHVSSDQARRRVYDLAKMARKAGFGMIYKKTDSTLRGNIGSELAGLLAAWPGSSLLYVPAYPQMGRTMKQGVLHVDGQPVSATNFGSDPLNPVSESSIPALLRPHIRLPVVTVNREELRQVGRAAAYVCDAESEEEVWGYARFFVKSGAFSLAAGPSAFLAWLARELDLPHRPPPRLPRVPAALIVSLSRNKSSVAQLQYAAEQGFPMIDVTDSANGIGGRDWWILRTDCQAVEAPDEAARRVASNAVSALGVTGCDALVVFGGDTAYAVLRALGEDVLYPIGEALEGVPVSRLRGASAGGSDLILVTKAGGFAPMDVLPRIRRVLAGR